MGRLLWLLRKKFCPETFTCDTATGAEVSFRMRTFVVAVCPTGTAPKLMEPGETLSGPAVEEFDENPQPARAMMRQHASVTKSFAYETSSVRIGPRPPALYELNNASPLCKRACFPEADKKKNCKSITGQI